MKKLLFVMLGVCLLSVSSRSYAQLIDEKDVTVTMDLQPILQLNMATSDQIDFVFDDITKYYTGITKYAATVLKVSSSVSWDLYACGTSQAMQAAAANRYWDSQLFYSQITTNGSTANIPLSALELHQYPNNAYTMGQTGQYYDYRSPFESVGATGALATTCNNSIYVSSVPYGQPPTVREKYIGGSFGAGVAALKGEPAGSYLYPTYSAGTSSSQFEFIIDYRLVPSLPATFPFAAYPNGAAIATAEYMSAGTYARPGVYTMDVKYILLEDQ